MPGGIDLRVAWPKSMLDAQGEDQGQTRRVYFRSGLVGFPVFSTYSEYSIRALLCLAVLIFEVPSQSLAQAQYLVCRGRPRGLGRSALVGPSVFSI